MTPVTSPSLVPTSTSNESHTRSVELRARSRYAVQRVSHSFRRSSRSFQIRNSRSRSICKIHVVTDTTTFVACCGVLRRFVVCCDVLWCVVVRCGALWCIVVCCGRGGVCGLACGCVRRGVLCACGLCLCVCVCVSVLVKKNPVCRFQHASVCTLKTSPCVPATCPHVQSMWTFCQYTRGRFERTHGGVFECTHWVQGLSSSVLLTKICPRWVITCFRGSPKKPLDLFHFQV